jgi:hypothetical protein
MQNSNHPTASPKPTGPKTGPTGVGARGG